MANFLQIWSHWLWIRRGEQFGFFCEKEFQKRIFSAENVNHDDDDDHDNDNDNDNNTNDDNNDNNNDHE